MGRGQWGEGFSGSTIKDTWTNPKGVGLRVEVGDGYVWWGENGKLVLEQ